MMLAFVHCFAAVGGCLGKRYRLPAGMMIGAMAAVALLNLVSGFSDPSPRDVRAVVQICSGVVIGSRFTRKDLAELREAFLSTLLMIVGMLAINVLFGRLVSLTSHLSPITALFATAPGGLTDLAIIAVDFGADTQQVTLLQVFRFVFVLSFFPPLIRRRSRAAAALQAQPPATDRPVPKEELSAPAPDQSELPAAAPPKKDAGKYILIRDTLFALGCGALGGYFFLWLRIPAGAIIGSIFASVILSLSLPRGHSLPKWLRPLVQISCGCYIGCQITRAAVWSLGGLLLPMLFLLLELFVLSFGLSWVIHKLTGLDQTTAICSCIPAGLSEIVLLADDLHLDTPKIALAQTCRLIAVICFIPLLARLVMG